MREGVEGEGGGGMWRVREGGQAWRVRDSQCVCAR